MILRHLLAAVICLGLLGACDSMPFGKKSGDSSNEDQSEAAKKAEKKKEKEQKEQKEKDAKKAKEKEKEKEQEGEIIGDIPPGSPFSKIKIGMGMRQVHDLIGPPNDQNHYVTGKSWIPWYFGDDRSRVETFYKNQGRLTFTGGGRFSSGGELIRIEYDASESGYKK